MSAKNKLVLDINEMQDDFFGSSALLGIASSWPAHRLCWSLNQQFLLDFKRQPELDIEFHKNKQEPKYFSIYEYCVPLSETRHLLYRLKNGQDTLLPELKQLDYLWMITGEDAEHESHLLLQDLRALPQVQLAQSIDRDRLKNLGWLLV